MTASKHPFRVIEGGAAAAQRYGSPRELLKRVLKAQLTPTLTVEQASHLNIPYLEDNLPTMDRFLADFNVLRSVGLDVRIQLGDLPEGVVLTDPELFTARFPELAVAVPVMLAHDGVQPYTEGIPRRLHAKDPAKPARKQATRLALV
jgi:hypothetical protein